VTPSAASHSRLRLVDYSVRAPSDHTHAQTGPTITLGEVRRHARCMRSEGFAIPAPTAQPGGGWSVLLDEPERRGLNFRSQAFRRAWFVTCGLLGGPLSGDLVISGPRTKIDRFRACMSRHGFDLPQAVTNKSTSDGTDEWQFDLTRTGIDTSTRAWNQAMFVDCAPQDQ
jgi:hypothetical protein